MIERATDRGDDRRLRTTRTLLRVARAWTAERGLSGFTIEELCAEAGVSRRTFFNYFASKDDAVLGIPISHNEDDRDTWFLARGAHGGGISPTLLTDLAELFEARWRDLDIAPETIADLGAAVDKEPRLLGRVIELGRQAEASDARLVEQREGLPGGDLRAELAAQIVGAIGRGSAAEFLSAGNTTPFSDIFRRRIDAANDLFSTQTTLIGAHP